MGLAADVIEARRQLFDDVTPLVPDLQVLIRSAQLDRQRRLRAVRTLVIAADCLLDVELATEAFEAVVTAPEPELSSLAAQDALLIYHAVFGDRATAIQIADYLEAASETQVISSRLVATLCATVAARRIVKAGKPRYEPLIALYERCASAKMVVAATSVASHIGNHLAEDGDFEEAFAWVKHARHWVAQRADRRLGCDYLSLEFDLALHHGDYNRALTLSESALEVFPSYASPRFAKERLVTQVRHKLFASHAPIDDQTIAQLLEWHHRAKCLGRHDDHMEALWGALVTAGRGDEASRLLEEYILSSRRERRHLNYWLATRTASDPFWRHVDAVGMNPNTRAILPVYAAAEL
jgi:hypothetical protein